tara:strand:+ start:525 stop:770 length:246 start_codon:yes stop_codon:yes gene_type:complete
MGKSSRRNRKKNPKQFKINQQNAIEKKKNQGRQRSKGFMVVAGMKTSGSARSDVDKQYDKLKQSFIFRELTDSYTEFGFTP